LWAWRRRVEEAKKGKFVDIDNGVENAEDHMHQGLYIYIIYIYNPLPECYCHHHHSRHHHLVPPPPNQLQQKWSIPSRCFSTHLFHVS
jgi:hypothetical protein